MTNFIPGIFFPGVLLILVVENLSFLRGVGAKATVRRGVRGTPFEKLIRGYDGPAKSNMQHQLRLCILAQNLKVTYSGLCHTPFDYPDSLLFSHFRLQSQKRLGWGFCTECSAFAMDLKMASSVPRAIMKKVTY